VIVRALFCFFLLKELDLVSRPSAISTHYSSVAPLGDEWILVLSFPCFFFSHSRPKGFFFFRPFFRFLVREDRLVDCRDDFPSEESELPCPFSLLAFVLALSYGSGLFACCAAASGPLFMNLLWLCQSARSFSFA